MTIIPRNTYGPPRTTQPSDGWNNTPATKTVTFAGAITYTALWFPISDGATVAAA